MFTAIGVWAAIVVDVQPTSTSVRMVLLDGGERIIPFKSFKQSCGV